MAAVHLGTMVGPAGERRVAIKQLAAEDALDERARLRLIDEARLVFRLTHANICQVFDLASSSEGTFVVMEFVDGLDLRALVRRAGRLELPHALYIAREVARALDYAHRRTDDSGRPLLLVHGDVTPANVLLSCEGEVKLADFGIARALGSAPDRAHPLAGTPGFVAPELKTHATSQRADLYALGITLYVALTGVRPGDPAFAPRALRRARPDASVELERLVARATAADPRARIASAAQLEQGLAIELARQFAEFTPSSLARAVRAHRDAAHAGAEPPAADAVLGPVLDQELDQVLESMTATIDAKPLRAPPAPAPPGTVTLLPRSTETAPAGRSRRWPWLVAFVLAVAGLAAYREWPRGAVGRVAVSPPLAAPAAPAPRLPPPAAPLAVDAMPAAVDAMPAAVDAMPPLSSPAIAEVTSPARATPRGRRYGEPPHHTEHPARHAAAPAAPVAPGYLTVTARTWGAVYVDGKQVAPQTPLYRHPLPAGVHAIKIFQPAAGEYSSVQQVEVRAGETAELSFK